MAGRSGRLPRIDPIGPIGPIASIARTGRGGGGLPQSAGQAVREVRDPFEQYRTVVTEDAYSGAHRAARRRSARIAAADLSTATVTRTDIVAGAGLRI